jgi:hypothetical protein
VSAPPWRDLISGNPTHEDDVRQRFLEASDKRHQLVPEGDDKMLIEVGTTGWQCPLRLIKHAKGWYYDVEPASKKSLRAKIGRDEYTAIQTLLAIVDAQQDYVSLDPMKFGVPTYARRLLSSPGQEERTVPSWSARAARLTRMTSDPTQHRRLRPSICSIRTRRGRRRI